MTRKRRGPDFSAGSFLVDVDMPNGFLHLDDFLNTEVLVLQRMPPKVKDERIGKMRVRDIVEKFG